MNPDEATIAEAMHFSDEGDLHFNLAEYDQAITAYKEAYRLYASPVFLYNLGQSYRLQGDCANARRMYANYLRLRPDDPNKSVIEAQLAEMEKCAHRKPEPPPDPPPPEEHVGPPRDDGRSGRTLRRRVGIGLLAGGVAMLATGAYFGLDARSAADEVSERYASGGVWDDEIDATEERGQRSSVVGVALLGTGAALAIIGGALWYFDREPAGAATASPAISIDLRPGSRTAMATWRF